MRKGIIVLNKFYRYRFMFEELVKRYFKKKYKRTVLGMGWSVLSPLLQLRRGCWLLFPRQTATNSSKIALKQQPKPAFPAGGHEKAAPQGRLRFEGLGEYSS